MQYEVLCEDNFQLARLRPARVLLAESLAVFTATEAAVVRLFESAGGLVLIADQSDWLDRMSRALRDREIVLSGPSTLRAYVRDDARRTVVHLLNLGIARLSSFTDQITPASDVRVAVRVPFKRVRAVEALTADNASSAGKLQFSTRSEKGGLVVASPHLAGRRAGADIKVKVNIAVIRRSTAAFTTKTATPIDEWR